MADPTPDRRTFRGLGQDRKQTPDKHLRRGRAGRGGNYPGILDSSTEGNRRVSRLLDHYSLDAILAVGYRVRSPVATAFRQWATARLREYLVKGFTLNDDRLKGVDSVTDYFDELLARIREIRASEARVYQRIREIFSLAVDYREGEQETQRFFATMQNKMHLRGHRPDRRRDHPASGRL